MGNAPVMEFEVSPAGRSAGSFVRHFLEMVLAMMAGMMILGGVVRMCVLVLGESGLYDHTALRALIMTVNMTVGMCIWMQFRGHHPQHTAEMAAAMVLPLAILIYPFWAGLISPGALLGGMHVLMLPAMAGVMLMRRDVYATHHGGHGSRVAGQPDGAAEHVH